MDFDEGEWQDAARAVREAAKSHGLQASVERSRSGNGCHIWFFFECPVSAKLARDFGSALISEAMAQAFDCTTKGTRVPPYPPSSKDCFGRNRKRLPSGCSNTTTESYRRPPGSAKP